MLQKLRDRTSGWAATIVIGLLTLPFLLVVDQGYMGGLGANSVAQVKAPPTWWSGAPSWWPVSKVWRHEDVGVEEFRQRFEQERMQQRQQQGEDFDPRAFESIENKRRVLEGLIDEKALLLAASRAGITVGDAAVRDYIESIPAFQVDGRFDATRYQLALSSQVPARTPRQFEELVRQSLQQSLLPSGIGTSAFATEAEVDRILRLSGETRDAEVALLPLQEEDAAAVSEAELQAWYDAHKNDFLHPESVAIEYVEVGAGQLPAPAEADEATLRSRYQEERARFVEPERRLASHILVRVEAGADEATRKAAEEKAARLAGEAAAEGADFDALAKANSEDPGSRDSGGDLGWVERGLMVAPFEEALFAMQPGEVRGPVKTDFGYHVLKLREVDAGAQVPFEQAREELAREQAQADSERAYSELTGRLTDLIYQNPSSLEPAARETGLQVQKLGPFTREQAMGVAAAPGVRRAAFSEALIEDGTASDPIELGPNHSVVIRVIDHAPEQARPLAEVHEAVEAAIRADRREKAAVAAAEALVERLKAGEALADVAAGAGAEVVPLQGLPRGAPVPSQAANRILFEAAPPEQGKPSVGRFGLQDGRQAVFVLDAVHPGKPEELSKEQREQLRGQLAQLDGAAAADDYVRRLRQRFVVVVQESQL
ncbi:peptidylprolyl isomerase [Pseudoxanthomonas broegbernensis]|uniref:Periplasmic chaperone PpiD n=1 Tax=Pseudoxanthomonas broegbernensis TaxID=83619 RepID=A0A7V8GP36_9GAMM|nr:peptidyl-prolyl cis-trans isomerase [Pseudoxanthomonas broegbernensis]KAF1687492.1 peptidylprolyl isomerase [Pseudoxanthomonas broegbernensis]MBB6064495.1 peptidyl-prolyl cis-trans isomerase D [Pseudoxanthomonas broegbernensis]